MVVSKPKAKPKKAKAAPSPAPVKLKPNKPKIRIQKVSGLAGLPHRDLAVDLSDLPHKAKKPTPQYYSEEEDDSLVTPTAKSERLEPEELEDDQAEELDETADEPSLSLDDIDEPIQPTKGTKDYAAKAAGPDETTATLKRIYDDKKPADKKAGPLYLKLAITFAVMVVAIVGAVLYFTAVKTTIAVSLNRQEKSDKLTVNLSGGSVASGAIAATVKQVEAEQSKIFAVTGTEVIGEEVAGTVIIYNKNNKSQPLVATTRLLSASGKLYRLKTAVNVPAGGQVSAAVYADQPSESAVVGAEKFIIPGLWQGLQDKVYAESQEGDIKYGRQTKKVITQAIIDQALTEIKQAALDKVKADADNTYSNNNLKLVKEVENSATTTIDAAVGEEKDSFSVTLRAKYDVAAFNDAAVKELLDSRVAAALPVTSKLVEIKSDNLTYELTKLDSLTQTAETTVTYTAVTEPASLDATLDKKKLTNLSDEQLKTYLRSLPEIKAFEVRYFPAFIKKTPGLVDRITIETMR